MRHVKDCKFWKDYGRCKFGQYCSFKHRTKDLNEENRLGSVIKKFETKIELLKDYLENEISEIKSKMEGLEKEKDSNNEAKDKVLADITNLEARQSQLEQETYARCGDVETKVRTIIDALTDTQEPQPNLCNMCKRTFLNHQSLEHHMRNHHQPNLT